MRINFTDYSTETGSIALPANVQLEALTQRQSTPARDLVEPAPSADELEAILQAAMSAPDHGLLRPWRFIIIRGAARTRLGELMAASLSQRDPHASAEDLTKQRNKPLRSPLIVVVAANIQHDHPKVPEQEQILSAGCAAQHIQLAAQSLGYGSIWLTGPAAYDWSIAEALGLEFDDKIIGFIYMGTPNTEAVEAQRPKASAYTREWLGELDPTTI